MNAVAGDPRPLPAALVAASAALTLLFVVATDVAVLTLSTDPPLAIIAGLVVLNLGCVLQSLVGGLIEWRRPGHRIGRLLLVGGPLYAVLASGWLAADLLRPVIDPTAYLVLNWAGSLLAFPGVALVAGWIPLLFPTGRLPGPRWVLPAGAVVVLSGIGVAAWAVRPGPLVDGTPDNPFGIAGWPAGLQVFIDLLMLELVALLLLAAAALVVRYRRGAAVERLQIRWLLASVAVIVAGFAGVIVEQLVREDDGPLVSAMVGYAGILLMPIAIGIAILRYRLYEIDRIISRTIGWTLVTGILVALFAGLVVGLQAVFAGVTQGSTLAVAASTLVAFALFQPLRHRVQHAVDRRFDRARYDGERVAAAFAERLRDQVDLEHLRGEVVRTAHGAVRPASAAVWLRNARNPASAEGS